MLDVAKVLEKKVLKISIPKPKVLSRLQYFNTEKNGLFPLLACKVPLVMAAGRKDVLLLRLLHTTTSRVVGGYFINVWANSTKT